MCWYILTLTGGRGSKNPHQGSNSSGGNFLTLWTQGAAWNSSYFYAYVLLFLWNCKSFWDSTHLFVIISPYGSIPKIVIGGFSWNRNSMRGFFHWLTPAFPHKARRRTAAGGFSSTQEPNVDPQAKNSLMGFLREFYWVYWGYLGFSVTYNVGKTW